MTISRRASFAAGAIAALVLGSGTAVAATGGKLILGRANSATSTTTITNSNGTPLALNAKSGTAPLKVNSKKAVANLNADLLDGRSASAFASVNGQTGTIEATGQGVDKDGNGFPEVIVANAACPAGTVRTGGGGADLTKTGLMFVSIADQGSSWTVAVATDNATAEDPTQVTASAVCYNPVGAVAGNTTARATSSGSTMSRVSPQLRAKIVDYAAKR